MNPPLSEKQIIEQKLKELSALYERREQLLDKITKTETAIRALIPLLEDDLDQQVYSMRLTVAAHPVGLTESVKEIIKSAKGQSVEPTVVRDKLEESGFPLSGYQNPLAVIYTTIYRMQKQGLVKAGVDGFSWIGPDPVPAQRAQKMLRRRRVQRNPALTGVPNPYGKSLADMLKKPESK